MTATALSRARLKYRDVEYGDAELIAPKLRKIDLVECGAFGLTGLEALSLAYEVFAGEEAYTVTVDGVPEGMFGWTAHNSDKAAIWLLGSDALFEQPILFCRISQIMVEKAHFKHRVLFNFVSENNAKSIAWLKWLGFEFPGATVLGKNGETLRYFVRKRRESPAP